MEYCSEKKNSNFSVSSTEIHGFKVLLNSLGIFQCDWLKLD